MEDTITYNETKTEVTETTKTLTLEDVIKLVVNKVKDKVDCYTIYDSDPYLDVSDDGDECTIRLEGYSVDVYELFDGMTDDILDEITNIKGRKVKEETLETV